MTFGRSPDDSDTISLAWLEWTVEQTKPDEASSASTPCDVVGLTRLGETREITLSGRAKHESPNQQYQKSIAGALHVPTVAIQQLVRVDIDGNGKEEVVFEASYEVDRSGEIVHDPTLPDFLQQPTREKFSVVGYLWENKEQGMVATIIGQGAKGPLSALKGFVDLDGDNNLELVISHRADHWASTTVWRIHEGNAEKIGRADCGW